MRKELTVFIETTDIDDDSELMIQSTKTEGVVSIDFSSPEVWEIYEEPKQPRKLLAFVHHTGFVFHTLEDSSYHKSIERNNDYTRQEGFDLIEKIDNNE